MRLASYVISLCLHSGVFLLVWFWPQAAPLRLDSPPIMISLVEGAPGGNRTPSPIMGHMGEPGEGPKAPTPPAPQSEIAAPAREAGRAPEPKSVPVREVEPPAKALEKPQPVPVAENRPQPEPRQEPKPEQPKQSEIPKQEPKKPEPKKPEPKKPESKKPETARPAPKEQPRKAAPRKSEPRKAAPKTDPIEAALRQARNATSRASSGDRGNAVEQALAQAQRRASGNRGGGGGDGGGPGGGGLGDVYMGQVMLAVRPNWGFASSGRLSLVCVVKVLVDMQGNVLRAEVSKSSGNAQYDASAVNAVVRTGQAGEFPPPPNQEYTDLDLVFTMDELMGR